MGAVLQPLQLRVQDEHRRDDAEGDDHGPIRPAQSGLTPVTDIYTREERPQDESQYTDVVDPQHEAGHVHRVIDQSVIGGR